MSGIVGDDRDVADIDTDDLNNISIIMNNSYESRYIFGSIADSPINEISIADNITSTPSRRTDVEQGS